MRDRIAFQDKATARVTARRGANDGLGLVGGPIRVRAIEGVTVLDPARFRVLAKGVLRGGQYIPGAAHYLQQRSRDRLRITHQFASRLVALAPKELEGLLQGGGRVLFDEVTARNLIVTEGRNYIRDVMDGGAQIDPWFVLLTDSTPTIAAGDTLASHAGWVEFTAYTGSRQEWVALPTADGVRDNAASAAVFSITSDGQVVGGCGLSSVASGSAGTLYSAVAFTGGDRTGLDTGDDLQVTYTQNFNAT